METILLAAFDDFKLIGNQNKLPWNIPNDLKLFKERTLGNTVIFGRKTYDNLPKKPLKGRNNIIVTSQFLEVPEMLPKNTTIAVVLGVKEAIQYSKYIYPKNNIFICGGASIYKQALEQSLVDYMLISHIPGKYDGDIYFPEFDHMWDIEIWETYEDFNVEKWTIETK
jgi:dihydrofolate reductase